MRSAKKHVTVTNLQQLVKCGLLLAGLMIGTGVAANAAVNRIFIQDQPGTTQAVELAEEKLRGGLSAEASRFDRELPPFSGTGSPHAETVIARLQIDTGPCVAYLGAASDPEPAPDRAAVHGSPSEPDASILCQLAAGVSYSLAPGAALDVGYRLPNRALGEVGRNLGLNDEGADASAHEISVGVRLAF